MTINSISFFLFFIVVFAVYYLPIFRSSSKYQNLVLFVASYFFYAYSDWRMLALLLGATIVYYYLGIWLKKEIDNERWGRVTALTTIGVLLGVGVLLYFKYLNFFAESIASVLSSCGLHVSWNTLHIILPVGVSFFTFKLISYILEISRESIEPTKDFVKFGTYIAFFPTIMAGPIDRPNKFIPQLGGARLFDYSLAVDGCRQIIWGLFEKMCIADNLVRITSTIWLNVDSYSSLSLLLAALFSIVQLYADFDGYSNMAIGVGKIMGLRIAKNFDHPFFSTNIAEFWRRWHMSLTTWITDYVYTPLNYSLRKFGKTGLIIAITTNLLVIGLWHGAYWNYVMFGLYHAMLFILLIVVDKTKNTEIRNSRYFILKGGKIAITFLAVSIGCLIFVAPSFDDSLHYFSALLSLSTNGTSSLIMGYKIYILLFVFIVFEWLNRNQEYSLVLQSKGFLKSRIIRYGVYYLMVFFILFFQGASQKFVYFEF